MAKQQEINIICHYPETEEGRLELAKRAATIHAQAILSYIQKMNISKDQKLRLLDSIIDNYREQMNLPQKEGKQRREMER